MTAVVPPWKLALLERKRIKEQAERQKLQEEQAKLAALPEWKRNILKKKKEGRGVHESTAHGNTQVVSGHEAERVIESTPTTVEENGESRSRDLSEVVITVSNLRKAWERRTSHDEGPHPIILPSRQKGKHAGEAKSGNLNIGSEKQLASSVKSVEHIPVDSYSFVEETHDSNQLYQSPRLDDLVENDADMDNHLDVNKEPLKYEMKEQIDTGRMGSFNDDETVDTEHIRPWIVKKMWQRQESQENLFVPQSVISASKSDQCLSSDADWSEEPHHRASVTEHSPPKLLDRRAKSESDLTADGLSHRGQEDSSSTLDSTDGVSVQGTRTRKKALIAPVTKIPWSRPFKTSQDKHQTHQYERYVSKSPESPPSSQSDASTVDDDITHKSVMCRAELFGKPTTNLRKTSSTERLVDGGVPAAGGQGYVVRHTSTTTNPIDDILSQSETEFSPKTASLTSSSQHPSSELHHHIKSSPSSITSRSPDLHSHHHFEPQATVEISSGHHVSKDIEQRVISLRRSSVTTPPLFDPHEYDSKEDIEDLPVFDAKGEFKKGTSPQVDSEHKMNGESAAHQVGVMVITSEKSHTKQTHDAIDDEDKRPSVCKLSAMFGGTTPRRKIIKPVEARKLESLKPFAASGHVRKPVVPTNRVDTVSKPVAPTAVASKQTEQKQVIQTKENKPVELRSENLSLKSDVSRIQNTAPKKEVTNRKNVSSAETEVFRTLLPREEPRNKKNVSSLKSEVPLKETTPVPEPTLKSQDISYVESNLSRNHVKPKQEPLLNNTLAKPKTVLEINGGDNVKTTQPMVMNVDYQKPKPFSKKPLQNGFTTSFGVETTTLEVNSKEKSGLNGDSQISKVPNAIMGSSMNGQDKKEPKFGVYIKELDPGYQPTVTAIDYPEATLTDVVQKTPSNGPSQVERTVDIPSLKFEADLDSPEKEATSIDSPPSPHLETIIDEPRTPDLVTTIDVPSSPLTPPAETVIDHPSGSPEVTMIDTPLSPPSETVIDMPKPWEVDSGLSRLADVAVKNGPTQDVPVSSIDEVPVSEVPVSMIDMPVTSNESSDFDDDDDGRVEISTPDTGNVFSFLKQGLGSFVEEEEEDISEDEESLSSFTGSTSPLPPAPMVVFDSEPENLRTCMSPRFKRKAKKHKVAFKAGNSLATVHDYPSEAAFTAMIDSEESMQNEENVTKILTLDTYTPSTLIHLQPEDLQPISMPEPSTKKTEDTENVEVKDIKYAEDGWGFSDSSSSTGGALLF